MKYNALNVFALTALVCILIAIAELRKRVPRWYALRRTRIDTERIAHDLFD